MYAVQLSTLENEDQFRLAARACLSRGISPKEVTFTAEPEARLFPSLSIDAEPIKGVQVPGGFAKLVDDVICHSAADRFDLLYGALWRIVNGERDLLLNTADPTIAKLNNYARNVRHDIHKMHAFLRFRCRILDGIEVFTAWFEPRHHILRRAVPFFIERFTNQEWVIATPVGTATWRSRALLFGPPPTEKPEPNDDTILDELWLTYYRTTFNPARVRTAAMVKEMPRHYWRNLPETSLVPELVAGASERAKNMTALTAAPPPLFAERIASHTPLAPVLSRTSFDSLKEEAAACRKCPLYGPATQMVFGEGPEHARIMFVGEQPGDQEDLVGRPFVGPAGQLFDQALVEAGIDRSRVYVTNAVKHFKFTPRGKRRIHQKPNAGEVHTCRWWLDREIALLKPALIVALGGTAASLLAQRTVSVTRERGPMTFRTQNGFVTVHPSYLLRIPDPQQSEAEYRTFVEDLCKIMALGEP